MSTKTLTLKTQDSGALVRQLSDAFAKAKVSGVKTVAARGAVNVMMPLTRLSEYHFEFDEQRCSWTVSRKKIVLSLAEFRIEQRTKGNIFFMVLKRKTTEPKASSIKSSTNNIREIFYQRSLRALEELKLLDEQKLIAAVKAPTDYSVLLSALSTEEALENIRPLDPLASARLRGLEAKRKLLEAEGGTLSSAQVAQLLKVSRQAVDKRRSENKLLAVELGRKGYRYPVWQFGTCGVDKVLAVLKDRDAWEQLSFFLNPSDLLGDRTPLETLQKNPEDLADVMNAAAAYGEQGA